MRLEELTDKAIGYIFENYNPDRLSPWERNFMESVEEQWARNHRLSDRQKEILGEIWDRQP